MTEAMRPGPLADIRVLEIGQALALPMCGLMLADMGADVIKLEPPGGDASRALNQIFPGESKTFAIFNRGKRDVVIDVALPESRPAIEALVRHVDVVLVAMKPADLQRYGLTYEALQSVREDIVLLEQSGLGTAGPFGDQGAYDVVVQGLSGLAALMARDRGDAPEQVRPAYVDAATGIIGALGVVAALRHRDRTGEGQKVETSLLSSALSMGANILNWFAASDAALWEDLDHQLTELREQGSGFGEQRDAYYRSEQPAGIVNIYFRYYRTEDGFISVGALSPKLNQRLRAVIGVEDPRADPEFDAGTAAGWDALMEMVASAERVFREKPSAQWIERLSGEGIPCGPFNFPNEILDDPQIAANAYLPQLDHPLLGPYVTFAPPVRMSHSPVTIAGPSPALDADTDDILAEVGLTAELVAELRSHGAIGARSGPVTGMFG